MSKSSETNKKVKSRPKHILPHIILPLQRSTYKITLKNSEIVQFTSREKS